MITTTYPLSLSPGGVPLTIHVSQYDTGSRSICLELYDAQGTLQLPSGVKCAVRGTKRDGNGFDYPATISGSAVTIDLTEQMTAVAGKTVCEIVLYTGTAATTETPASSDYTQLATANFILDVERAALDKDTLTSASEIRQLIDVVDRTDEILAGARQADAAREIIEGIRDDTLRYRTEAVEAAGQAKDSVNAAEAAKAAAVQAKTDAEAALAQIQQDGSEALSAIQAAHTRAMSDIQNSQDTALSDMNQVRDAVMRDVGNLKQSAEANLTTLAEETVSEITSLRNEAASALTDSREKAISEISALHSESVSTIRDEKTQALTLLEEVRAEGVRDVENEKSEASNLIARQRADAEEEIRLLKQMSAESLQEDYNRKKSELEAIRMDTVSVARQALDKATNAENNSDEAITSVESMDRKLSQLSLLTHGKVDDAYVEDGFLYMTSEGDVVVGPLGPFSGTGGGGGGGDSGNNAHITVTNKSGFLSRTVAEGDSLPITVNWSSEEDDMPTGSGTLKVTVSGTVKAVLEVAQGDVTLDLKPYLSSGFHVVKINIADVYGNNRTISFSITVVVLSISSTFDASAPFTEDISFPYTPVGNVQKTVHFVLDGREIGTHTTSVTNRQQTFLIPQQSHGSHALTCWFESEINGQIVKSNELYYEFISLAYGEDDPIIVSPFHASEQDQYATIRIPFTVYDPLNAEAELRIEANGQLVSVQTVDRSEQAFTYRADVAGEVEIRLSCRNTEKRLHLTIRESEITVEAETANLALYLHPRGRSNNEATREVWQSGSISAQLTGFNWRQNGWLSDSEGADVLRLTGDARVEIPYLLFGTDCKTTGKTIELEFATREVSDYSAEIISCFSGNIGLKITPQMVVFRGAQNEISTLYKDNEHIRLSIVVEKQNENRLIQIYINGIMSRTIQYASGERFSQVDPVGIRIGASDCGVDLYSVRVYDNNLSRQQILLNRIADTQDGALMVQRYLRNDIYDEHGHITVSTLLKTIPYYILEAEELPQYKGDKKVISGSYVDPVYPSRSFTFENCQINVQGTSSAPYYRKNYDLQFKGGFMTAGGPAEKYALRSSSIPNDRFVLKADVASSESTNNTGLTMFYNDTCPYKTPEMLENPRVRWGIEGIPIVVFWYNPSTQETTFLGKYNFNLPKRAPDPLGFTGTMESWEWQRNNSANVKFQDDDFDTLVWSELDQEYYPAWYDDFEARFPDDTWRDYSALKELLSWVKSTWRERATGALLDSPVTYRLSTTITLNDYSEDDSYTVEEEKDAGGISTGYKNITFTRDTPAYRLTKFRAECESYVELSSAVFYYLFTELFLMIDSRAKNMFIGFNGSPIQDSGRAMKRKATFQPYDMDTAIGTNNSGVLMFGYALEDTDHVSSIISGSDSGGTDAPVFNAQDSVFWCNLRDAFRAEITTMYRSLRADRAWSYAVVEKMYEDHQATWPEAVFNEDSWTKYIIPLVDPVTVDESTGELIRTDRYLTMLQGSKEQQRKWWLYNRFRYMDSKFATGDAFNNLITLRLFGAGTLRVTPAIDMYAAVAFGGGTTVSLKRTTANTEADFAYLPATGVTEMETWIYSGDLIRDVGDLSVFYPNECDFSKATRLKRLKIGDESDNYSNANLKTIDVRNCPLLEEIDVRHCPNLAITVNLENSPRLREAYFDHTAITGVELADGGALETLHLPGTITALTLMNLYKLQDFQVESYANVNRLMLSGVDTNVVDPIDILGHIQPGSQVNIQGLYIEAENAAEIDAFLDFLDTMQGVTREKSSSGEWIYHSYEQAQVSGTIHTDSLTGADIARFNGRYPYLTIEADHTESTLTYMSEDGSTTLYTEIILDGGDGTYNTAPEKAGDVGYSYVFAGWSRRPNSEAQEDAAKHVLADRVVYAAYRKLVKSYYVYFYLDWQRTTLLKQYYLPYGSEIVYDGQEPEMIGVIDPENYEFSGWDRPLVVTGTMYFYAQFTYKGDVVPELITRGYYRQTNYAQLTEIGPYAFYNMYTQLSTSTARTFNIPNVERIGSHAFADWSFGGGVFIPLVINAKRIRIVDDYGFAGNGYLEPNSSFDNLEQVGDHGFYNVTHTYGEVSFPALSSVGEYAFFRTNYTGVTIPLVEDIPAYAFGSCPNLTYVSCDNVKTIGAAAFSACQKLSSFNFENVTSIGTNAFYGTGIVSVNAPVLQSLSSFAFSGCYSLAEVSVGAGFIGASAFYGCRKLSSVNLPNATIIDYCAFGSCSSLKELSAPNVSAIYGYAFAGCSSLQSISLPNVTRFLERPFSFCLELSYVYFGKPFVPYSYAFYQCPKLETVVLDTPSVFGFGALFSGTPMNASSYLGHYGSIYVRESLLSSFISSNPTFSSRFAALETLAED